MWRLSEGERTRVLIARALMGYRPTSDKTASFYEGCLSFDGYQAVRKRWLDITAEWDDEVEPQRSYHAVLIV